MKTLLLTIAVVALSAVGRSQNDNVSVDLKEVLGPNNTFHDRLMGVSLTYPAGWELLSGRTDPKNSSYHTFSFRPLWPSEASPSFYYNRLRPDGPWLKDIPGALLEQARKQEAVRQTTIPDYRIDPETLLSRTIGGRPALSYVATRGSGAAKVAEYYLRIIGEKTFLGFYATGRLEDVLAIRSEIEQMAETAKVP